MIIVINITNMETVTGSALLHRKALGSAVLLVERYELRYNFQY